MKLKVRSKRLKRKLRDLYSRTIANRKRLTVLFAMGVVSIAAWWILRDEDSARASTAPQIQVRVLESQTPITIRIDGLYQWTDDDGKSLIDWDSDPPEISIRPSGDKIALGKKTFPSPIVLESSQHSKISIGSMTIQGHLILINENGTLHAINEIDIETYVAGVLFSEMPAYFEVEALKAQSIAVRSFAWDHISRRKTPLHADDRSQVYGGVDGPQFERARSIVEETFGQVLYFDDSILPAFFHSTCGGETAAADLAFGGTTVSPLKGSHCGACADSPRYRWTVELLIATLESDVLNLNAKETLESISLRAREDQRAGSLIFKTSQRELKLGASEFRRKSRPHCLSGDFYSSNVVAAHVQGTRLFIEGAGFGHGAGLCQYGAQGLALRGETCMDILENYYPGAIIRTAWKP